MLGRVIQRIGGPAVKTVRSTPAVSIRLFGGHSDAAKPAAPINVPAGVVTVTEIHDSLEWCLSSPMPLHQFEEQPIVVEIEHLDNLVPEEVTYG